MLFWNRKQELAALGDLDGAGGLAVVWGRRRIGKTRLLLEWCERGGGVYTVADQAVPELQRAYFARAISQALPGFADVTYPDWERLLSRLAADAMSAAFTGPIVIDELPYLVAASPGHFGASFSRCARFDGKGCRLTRYSTRPFLRVGQTSGGLSRSPAWRAWMVALRDDAKIAGFRSCSGGSQVLRDPYT